MNHRIIVHLLLAIGAVAPAAGVITPWEAGDGDTTPRYDETIACCRDLAAAWPGQLSYRSFGVSPEGRELPLLIADAEGRFTVPAPDDTTRAVILIQACIHAGECCGKDAGLVLLRDLARDAALPPAVTILFIPILNVDGHERFSPYGRINQDGPRQMGWRTNARNLNLNRDYLKADSPEIQAWLALWNDWSPDLLVDCHSTDGADYQYDMTWLMETGGNLDPAIAAWNRDFLAGLAPALAARGYLLGPYVSFVDWHDPRSGLRSEVADPRLSHGYAALRNRPGLTTEAHVLKPYPRRVGATLATLAATIAHVQRDHAHLRRLNRAADLRASGPELRSAPLPLRWRPAERTEPFAFLGYDYEEVASELSGGTYFVYHPDRPRTFDVAWQREQVPAATVEVPAAYLVPPAWQDVIARLECHGVAVRRLDAPATLTVRSYRLRDVSWQARPNEGRHPVSFAAEPLTETRTFPAGTAVVSTAQRAARVIVHALEPEGPDSLLRWGFFDPIFQQAEYAENYAIEPLMKRMVAARPGLLDSLAAADTARVRDAAWIRNWFYRRTPYFDVRLDVYPVGAVDDPAVLAGLDLE